MKAAAFEYFAPETVDEVVSLLAEHGDEAKILAGGQSLLPLMALRMANPEVLVDINRAGALGHVDSVVDTDGTRLRIGALVRHRTIERLPGLAAACPMIADAVEQIGHVAIRNRGTVVGSLTHSDPAAEWPALAIALDGEVTAVGPGGTRRIPAASFFESYLTNALADDEIATRVELRLPGGRGGSAFVELARRHGDFAIVGVGAVLWVSERDAITDARLVVAGAGATALRMRDAERVLIGQSPSAELFAEAAQAVYESVAPTGDIQGSAAYRRTVTRVVTRRALAKAHRRVSGEGVSK